MFIDPVKFLPNFFKEIENKQLILCHLLSHYTTLLLYDKDSHSQIGHNCDPGSLPKQASDWIQSTVPDLPILGLYYVTTVKKKKKNEALKKC